MKSLVTRAGVKPGLLAWEASVLPVRHVELHADIFCLNIIVFTEIWPFDFFYHHFDTCVGRRYPGSNHIARAMNPGRIHSDELFFLVKFVNFFLKKKLFFEGGGDYFFFKARSPAQIYPV